jgi:hypothetical protein
MSKLNAAKSGGCVGNDCPPQTYPDLNSAGTMATVSTVGFIVGGAGVALGIVGLVVGGRGSTSEGGGAQTRVTPYVGLGGAGLRGTF